MSFSREIMIEPRPLSITRDICSEELHKKILHQKEPVHNERKRNDENCRSAGDGMESITHPTCHHVTCTSCHSSLTTDYTDTPLVALATSTPVNSKKVSRRKSTSSRGKKLYKADIIDSFNSENIVGQLKIAASESLLDEDFRAVNKIDLQVKIEELQVKVCSLELINDKVIDEKLRLSSQLGVQTKVNAELKKLLVASVGEDLERRFEQLNYNNASYKRETRRLEEQLECKQEECDGLSIQCDVWRSKFLASKVMSDELASWKATLDGRYRESYTALQTLLEEHAQLRTLVAASNRFLLRVTQLVGCFNPDDEKPGQSPVDMAVTNHSLAKKITETIIQGASICIDDNDKERIYQNQESILSEEQNRSLAEQKALQILNESEYETEQMLKQRKDYLAHNRISHFLSTKYHLTCITCRGCKGKLKIV